MRVQLLGQDQVIVQQRVVLLQECSAHPPVPVSYTHLDVYKRQIQTLDIARGTGADGHPVCHLAFQQHLILFLEAVKRQLHLETKVAAKWHRLQTLICLLYTSRCV